MVQGSFHRFTKKYVFIKYQISLMIIAPGFQYLYQKNRLFRQLEAKDIPTVSSFQTRRFLIRNFTEHQFNFACTTPVLCTYTLHLIFSFTLFRLEKYLSPLSIHLKTIWKSLFHTKHAGKCISRKFLKLLEYHI